MPSTSRSPSPALRQFSELVASALDLSFSTPALASFPSPSPPDSPLSPVSSAFPAPSVLLDTRQSNLPLPFYHISPGTRSETRLEWVLAQRDASAPFHTPREILKSPGMPPDARLSSKTRPHHDVHAHPDMAPLRPRSPFPLSLISSRPVPGGELTARSKSSFMPSKYFPVIRKKPSEFFRRKKSSASSLTQDSHPAANSAVSPSISSRSFGGDSGFSESHALASMLSSIDTGKLSFSTQDKELPPSPVGTISSFSLSSNMDEHVNIMEDDSSLFYTPSLEADMPSPDVAHISREKPKLVLEIPSPDRVGSVLYRSDVSHEHSMHHAAHRDDYLTVSPHPNIHGHFQSTPAGLSIPSPNKPSMLRSSSEFLCKPPNHEILRKSSVCSMYDEGCSLDSEEILSWVSRTERKRKSKSKHTSGMLTSAREAPGAVRSLRDRFALNSAGWRSSELYMKYKSHGPLQTKSHSHLSSLLSSTHSAEPKSSIRSLSKQHSSSHMSNPPLVTSITNAGKGPSSRYGKSSTGVSGEVEDTNVGRVLALDEDPFAPSFSMGNPNNAGFINVPTQEAISAPVLEQALMKIRSPFSGSEATDTTPRLATFSGPNGSRFDQSESSRSHDMLLTAGHVHSPNHQWTSSPTPSLSTNSAQGLRPQTLAHSEDRPHSPFPFAENMNRHGTFPPRGAAPVTQSSLSRYETSWPPSDSNENSDGSSGVPPRKGFSPTAWVLDSESDAGDEDASSEDDRSSPDATSQVLNSYYYPIDTSVRGRQPTNEGSTLKPVPKPRGRSRRARGLSGVQMEDWPLPPKSTVITNMSGGQGCRQVEKPIPSERMSHSSVGYHQVGSSSRIPVSRMHDTPQNPVFKPASASVHTEVVNDTLTQPPVPSVDPEGSGSAEGRYLSREQYYTPRSSWNSGRS